MDGKKRSKPEVLSIFEYLRNGKYPDGTTPAKKRAIRRTARANFKIERNVLYFRQKKVQRRDIEQDSADEETPNEGGNWRKVLLSAQEVEDTLNSWHSSPLGGHFGRDKTLHKIESRFWWPNLVGDTKRFIAACPKCQKVNNKIKSVAPPLQPIPVTKPEAWGSIGIDLIGPLRETSAGNRFICTVTCYYTKMAQARALPSKHATGVAKFLLDLFLCFGFPRTLLSDLGREFNNRIIEGITDALQVVHRRTTAYHPQCNGLTERFNQTLEAMLLKLDEVEWDSALPQVVFGYNTSKQASTGFTPFYLMYGRDPIFPSEVDDGNVDEAGCSTVSSVSEEDIEREISSRVVRMKEVVGKAAVSNIASAQKRQKRNFDRRHILQQDIPVGSLVLKKNLRRCDRKGGKEELPWNGPYVIRGRAKSGAYLLSTREWQLVKPPVNGANLKPWVEGNEEEK